VSDLGDEIRKGADLLDEPHDREWARDMAGKADRLERELFDALHAPQVSDPYQAGYDMGMRVAAEFQEQARAAREVSMAVVRDRDMILDAKMALDLKVERIQRVMDEYEDWFDGAIEDSWRLQRDLRAAMEG
jgi:hypothetical protein